MREPFKTLAIRFTENLKAKYGDRLISVAVFGSVARGEEGKTAT